MALTDRDIVLFARDAVESQSDVLNARTPKLKAKFLRQHRLAARSYYEQAQRDVRDSGYRITQRVRDGLWAELERIAKAEDAAAPFELTPEETAGVQSIEQQLPTAAGSAWAKIKAMRTAA
jgi:hypothetical protein